MSAFSTFLANKVLDHVLRGQVYTPPSELFIALLTQNPTPGNIGTEVDTTGSGYARQSVTFGIASNHEIKNIGDIVFSEATSDWGTITHIGIYDSSTGGELLFFGGLENSRPIFTGDTLRFNAEDLVISVI